jgi:hypothetical protein
MTLRATVVGIACGYEACAILTRRVPTVSALCARHRYLTPAVLVVLGVHLWRGALAHSAEQIDG